MIFFKVNGIHGKIPNMSFSVVLSLPTRAMLREGTVMIAIIFEALS